MSKGPQADWDGTYPVDRLVLGMLGMMGIRGTEAARIVRTRRSEILNSAGEQPSIKAFSSRMDHGLRYPDEMKRVQQDHPTATHHAILRLAEILPFLKNCRVTFDPVASPGTNAKAATAHNRGERVIKSVKQITKKPRGASKMQTTNGPPPANRRVSP